MFVFRKQNTSDETVVLKRSTGHLPEKWNLQNLMQHLRQSKPRTNWKTFKHRCSEQLRDTDTTRTIPSTKDTYSKQDVTTDYIRYHGNKENSRKRPTVIHTHTHTHTHYIYIYVLVPSLANLSPSSFLGIPWCPRVHIKVTLLYPLHVSSACILSHIRANSWLVFKVLLLVPCYESNLRFKCILSLLSHKRLTAPCGLFPQNLLTTVLCVYSDMTQACYMFRQFYCHYFISLIFFC